MTYCTIEESYVYPSKTVDSVPVIIRLFIESLFEALKQDISFGTK